MDPVKPIDEQTLRTQLAQAREKLDGLVRKLRAVDGELEALSGERAQHQTLHEVCTALDKLTELGGVRLFWGEDASDVAGADHLRVARGRIEAFQKRLSEIEERREELLDEIEQQQRSSWFIEEDILEAQEQAQRRAEEWAIEREVESFPFHSLVMPWTRGGEEDQRFRKALAISLLLALLLSLLPPLIPLPLPELQKPLEMPERMTRLIPERPPTPPPQEVVPQQRKPEPADKLVAEKDATKRGPKEAAEEAPGSKGILAFREQFAGLADAKPLARLGAEAAFSRQGEVASGAPERAMVTTRASGSSGGVNLAALSRGVGGTGGQQLDGVQVARAKSSIGAADGTGRPVAGDGLKLGRTDEEIQIVFDAPQGGVSTGSTTGSCAATRP